MALQSDTFFAHGMTKWSRPQNSDNVSLETLGHVKKTRVGGDQRLTKAHRGGAFQERQFALKRNNTGRIENQVLAEFVFGSAQNQNVIGRLIENKAYEILPIIFGPRFFGPGRRGRHSDPFFFGGKKFSDVRENFSGQKELASLKIIGDSPNTQRRQVRVDGPFVGTKKIEFQIKKQKSDRKSVV